MSTTASELRSPLKEKLLIEIPVGKNSDEKKAKSAAQKRLESYPVKSPTKADFENRMVNAQKIRSEHLKKITTPSKEANKRAVKAKETRQAKENEPTVTLDDIVAKQEKASAIRAKAQKTLVEKNLAHQTHAKEVAKEVKEQTDVRLQLARQHVQESLEAASEKRAAQMETKKKACGAHFQKVKGVLATHKEQASSSEEAQRLELQEKLNAAAVRKQVSLEETAFKAHAVDEKVKAVADKLKKLEQEKAEAITTKLKNAEAAREAQWKDREEKNKAHMLKVQNIKKEHEEGIQNALLKIDTKLQVAQVRRDARNKERSSPIKQRRAEAGSPNNKDAQTSPSPASSPQATRSENEETVKSATLLSTIFSFFK